MGFSTISRTISNSSLFRSYGHLKMTKTHFLNILKFPDFSFLSQSDYFYFLTLYLVITSYRCYRISNRKEISINPIMVMEFFDVWGIDFMGPLRLHIGWSILLLLLIMYWSGWKQLRSPTIKTRVSPHSWRRISSPDLVSQGKLLVTEVPTFAICCLKHYWRNMVFAKI